jgi:uncharacterized cupin superfamily protein
MSKIDVAAISPIVGSSYPSPFNEPCRTRQNKRLGDAAGLTQFGVNLTRLPKGAWSSQRHWHRLEDEFIYVLEGEVMLVTDAGEERLVAGDCAGFKAGVQDGHHFQNRSNTDAVLLTIGSRMEGESGEYSDIDMVFKRVPGGRSGPYAHKDGTPY